MFARDPWTAWPYCYGGRLLAKPLMRMRVVVEGNVSLKNTKQVSSIHDNQLVQTFLTNGTNPTFSNGIGFRYLIGSQDDMNVFKSKHMIK